MAALILVGVATLGVGTLGLRLSRTTSDFYVASRAVSPLWNASAIGGEYLSAASFLGIAGLTLAYGGDILWYPLGYTAGYLVLLALVAAPLRRSGAYTLPDFAEIRLGSLSVRRMSSTLVVGIGWLYLLAQFHASGLALRTVTGAPSWLGGTLVSVIVLINVVAGGMRSITFVQAFQFWLKLTAISIPLIILIFVWRADGAPDPAGPAVPRVSTQTSVTVPESLRVRVTYPITVQVDGVVNGTAVDGPMRWEAGEVDLARGTQVTLPAGAPVPHAHGIDVSDGQDWVTPSSGAGGREYPLYRVYSLLLALLFGTMGLPHVLVRFYTNPTGRAARRTTLAVIPLLGLFYLFPPFYGALGRLYTPELLLTGRTDAVVLLLPSRMVGHPWAEILTALVTAGAFAAFLSTSSGLTVSVAGVLSQDLLRGRLRTSVQGFRIGSLIAVVVPAALSAITIKVSIADTVGLAFAVAASTFCPLLVLGIWWRGLTRMGAQVGLVVGGTLAVAATLITIAGGTSSRLANALLAQPAAWSVPIAFALMVGVSLATRRTAPPDAARVLVRLHAPEGLGLHAGPGGDAVTGR
ncbi:MAG: cation acetate symporter [Kineosporiaceae bacterium]|nr:cation acetate symporter [Kineosporiaceae bacterium]MBK7623890.1 cation acetate symporter [Kineosporiaceae bacterium]MBK8075549.1 cation acetate symporter [Kineosporiaceae bacterium]